MFNHFKKIVPTRIFLRPILFASFILLVILAFIPTFTYAQEVEAQLTISMIRNFGTAIGGNINGTFTVRANEPDNFESVTFYLDDEPMGTVASPPYSLKFNTDSYPPGTHTITAVGITHDEEELQSNSITRNFLTASENKKGIILLVVPLVLLIIAGRFVTNRLAKRGQETSAELTKINGPQGGTICPKCYKSFARHWWAPNLVANKYDRCPHCHKWSMVTRQSPELLQAALEAMHQAENTTKETPNNNEESDHKQRLDDSRFDQ